MRRLQAHINQSDSPGLVSGRCVLCAILGIEHTVCIERRQGSLAPRSNKRGYIGRGAVTTMHGCVLRAQKYFVQLDAGFSVGPWCLMHRIALAGSQQHSSFRLNCYQLRINEYSGRRYWPLQCAHCTAGYLIEGPTRLRCANAAEHESLTLRIYDFVVTRHKRGISIVYPRR